VDQSSRDWHVIVFADNFDRQLLRALVGEHLDMERADATRLAAHAPGVLARPLTNTQADRLVEALTNVGIVAEAWPVDRIPDLSEPRTMHKLICRVDGLEAFGLRGEPSHWLPWEHVELLSLGVLPRGSRDLSLSAPAWVTAAAAVVRPLLLGGPRSRPRRVRRREPVAPELWIIRARPLLVLRVQQDRMSYEYLGDRLQPSSGANFRVFLDDLVRSVPGAGLTPALQSFLNYDRPGHYFFSSAQQLMEYTTWQLLLRWRATSQA
jgi:hypothetical protein